jgi:hypothetical protein
MNIRAKKGTKVVFSNPNAGYPEQVALAAKHLKAGTTYTVERTEVFDWHTDVYLQEVPDTGFNSCFFEEK